MNIYGLIGRQRALFEEDLGTNGHLLMNFVNKGSFLVIGGAGSIGQAVVKELFKRKPQVLHVVDVNENNLVELVRDIRSSFGYIDGDFQTLPLDCGAVEFDAFVRSQNRYDYILNLSALKHVRSEKWEIGTLTIFSLTKYPQEKIGTETYLFAHLIAFPFST